MTTAVVSSTAFPITSTTSMAKTPFIRNNSSSFEVWQYGCTWVKKFPNWDCKKENVFLIHKLLKNRFLRERDMASNPKMEYQVFLCIFQKHSAMAILGMKEIRKFLREGREKGLSCWLSQFSQQSSLGKCKKSLVLRKVGWTPCLVSSQTIYQMFQGF